MNVSRYCLFIILTSSSLFCNSQIPDSSIKTAPQLSGRYYSKVDKKISSINGRLTKKSVKYLAKFQRRERKFKQKIENLHPGNATNVFTGGGEK
jgi:hypothetical protein